MVEKFPSWGEYTFARFARPLLLGGKTCDNKGRSPAGNLLVFAADLVMVDISL